MRPLQAWLLATRPRTLTATLAPVLVGSAVALHHQGTVSWYLVACALACVLCLQVATNLVNDVADYKKGADTPDRLGPPRATANGWLDPQSVWAGALLAVGVAIVAGMPLVMAGGAPLAWLGVASVVAAIAYTAGPFPLAYLGLGEIFVLVFFGWVGVCGLAFALTGAWPVAAFLAGTQVGLLSVTMIAINNLRDMDGDREHGKRTLAARYGEGLIRRVIDVGLFAPYALGLAWWAWSPWPALVPCLALPAAVRIRRGLAATRPSRAMNAFLGKASLHLLAFSLLLAGSLAWK